MQPDKSNLKNKEQMIDFFYTILYYIAFWMWKRILSDTVLPLLNTLIILATVDSSLFPCLKIKLREHYFVDSDEIIENVTK